MPACIFGVTRKEMDGRCFEGKIDTVQKLKYNCLWLFAFCLGEG